MYPPLPAAIKDLVANFARNRTELKLRLASGGLAPPEMVRVENEISGVESEIERIVAGVYGVEASHV